MGNVKLQGLKLQDVSTVKMKDYFEVYFDDWAVISL